MLSYRPFSIRLLFGLVLVMTVLALTTQNALLQSEAETPRPSERAAIPYLDVEQESPLPEPVREPDNLVPWSKIVFQSYRDLNWEIYGGTEDLVGHSRLTFEPASDIHPRFNRGSTRIVFASKRYGNYEIFAMNADGSGVVQLTNNSSDDGNPYWSPDGTRIVFEAYRDGQAEIYVMNADGSGQTRLTYDGDFDGYPAWSVDGSKIAFTSRRTGGYRIYTMNVDGSGLVQISQQPYSFNASWSPDGTQISYDADLDGDGWQELWLMNADGSNAHVIVDPAGTTDAWARSWSPNGQYIAYTKVSFIYDQGNWYWTSAYLYAYEVVGQYSTTLVIYHSTEWHADWQSIDNVPPTSSVNPLPAQSTNFIPVTWFGSDNYTNIRGFDVQVKIGVNGTWTDWYVNTTATSGAYYGVGGQTYYFRVRARDYNGNVEPWPATADAQTTVENYPPNTAVSPLPAYSRINSGGLLWVGWGGEDPGDSGIASYDVQYRIGSGNWIDWFIGTTNSGGYLSVTPGETYHFRSRAVDNAQNVEAWPLGDGDTKTVIYFWGITGSVLDNTGTPVETAVINTTPTSIFPSLSDDEGVYGAYVDTITPTYTVNWGKDVYGTLPDTQFPQEQDAFVEAVLPPSDNIVLNWGFETGNLSPEWSTGGTHPAIITSSLSHTGQYATFLGQSSDVFGDINVIGTPTEQHFPPYQTAMDSNDVLHVVWFEDRSGYGDVYYARRDQSGNWSTPIIISNNSAYWPRIVIDGNDVIHVVWISDEGFFYTQFNNGGWTTPYLFANGTYFDIFVGNNNVLHFVWKGYISGLFYKHRTTNGTWSTVETITGLGDMYHIRGLSDHQDNIHIMWLDGGANGYLQVFYSQRIGLNSWTTQQNISNQPQCHAATPNWGVDDLNVLHLVWECYQHYYYAQKQPGGNWSPGEDTMVSGYWQDVVVTEDGIVHLAGVGTYARRDPNGTWISHDYVSTTAYIGTTRIVVDHEGTPHIAWDNYANSSPDNNVYYVRQYGDGSWSSLIDIPDEASSEAFYPSIEIDSANQAHVVFSDIVTQDIMYRGPNMAEVGSDSSLSQMVTVPITASTPILSFMYQLYGVSVGNLSSLTVQVDDGSINTEVLNLNASAGEWKHQWVDLSDWLGETITVTFLLHQEVNEPIVWAYIDEVTLGSTYPDVWIDIDTTAALPGEQTFHTLTYGNQGGAESQNTLITYTLPADISFVTASVPPTLINGSVLQWELGSLPAKSEPFTITITGTVSLSAVPFTFLVSTAEISTPTTELEIHNNVAESQTFVATFIYLPLVFKN